MLIGRYESFLVLDDSFHIFDVFFTFFDLLLIVFYREVTIDRYIFCLFECWYLGRVFDKSSLFYLVLLFYGTLPIDAGLDARTLSFGFASDAILHLLLNALVYLTISYPQAVNIPLKSLILMQNLVYLLFERKNLLMELVLL